MKPDCVTLNDLENLVNRLNRPEKQVYLLSRRSAAQLNLDSLSYYADVIRSLDEQARTQGYQNLSERFLLAYDQYVERLQMASSSVCASVTLQLSQHLVMTRQAFRGTLKVKNGNDTNAMTDVRLNLSVTDEEGHVATEREFQTEVEALNNFEGASELGNGWTLGAQQTGTASILFIPTKYAAPTHSVRYTFSGTLSYVDPFTGLEKTMSLLPASLTVQPSANLELTYFMQRDIYGDDPLTMDVQEPVIPAEFALIINNKGYGEAKSVQMLTEQPRIVDNEKGLLVTFDIVSSQMDGAPAILSLGQTVASDFGTIDAHSQRYAQWWLESSLLGHFTSYDVQVNHLSSRDNPYLSLVDTATIHELIHGFTADDHSRGFLVNDIVDADDLPDAVYLTDGTLLPLQMATDASLTREKGDGEVCFLLKVTPSSTGWNYGSVAAPMGMELMPVRVVRQRDGVALPTDNVWLTDRTLRDGLEWLYENQLHYVVQAATTASEEYILVFGERPTAIAPVAGCSPVRDLHFAINGGWLTIKSEDQCQACRVELFDLRGVKRLDKRYATTDQLIYVGWLPAGVYQVLVTTDQGYSRAKLLKP